MSKFWVEKKINERREKRVTFGNRGKKSEGRRRKVKRDGVAGAATSNASVWFHYV